MWRPSRRDLTSRRLRSNRSWCDTADSVSPSIPARSQTHTSSRASASSMRTRVVSPSALKISAKATTVASASGGSWTLVMRGLGPNSEHLSNCSYVQIIHALAPLVQRLRGCQHGLVVRLVPGVFPHRPVADHTVLVYQEDRPLRD